MQYFSFSKKGNRPINADYLITDAKKGIFIIADAVGSNDSAKKTSQTACTIAHEECLKKEIKEPMIKIISALDEAHNSVVRNLPGSATTLDLLLIENKQAYIGHLGDSRVYLFRNHELRQLTEDHSIRHKIYQAIGLPDSVPDQINPPKLKRGDLIAMTTDGVHNSVSREDLTYLFNTGIALPDLAEVLIWEIERKGEYDNYTGILIRI
ncbi:SpoIIE family protein phosphatase [Candidatus Woesearchaeota archaeon]|nr:SpoIIE family protein phosphatase [Candidatus Woesearchaeota archaeon]